MNVDVKSAHVSAFVCDQQKVTRAYVVVFEVVPECSSDLQHKVDHDAEALELGKAILAAVNNKPSQDRCESPVNVNVGSFDYAKAPWYNVLQKKD